MGEGSETSCLYPRNLLRITGEKVEGGDSFLTLTVATQFISDQLHFFLSNAQQAVSLSPCWVMLY